VVVCVDIDVIVGVLFLISRVVLFELSRVGVGIPSFLTVSGDQIAESNLASALKIQHKLPLLRLMVVIQNQGPSEQQRASLRFLVKC